MQRSHIPRENREETERIRWKTKVENLVNILKVEVNKKINKYFNNNLNVDLWP